MRTNLKVNSKTNGTLKRKKENLLGSLVAGLMLSLISMVGMSFTTNDTTRVNDTVAKNAFINIVEDNGSLIMITPSNNLSIRKADLVMDANFRINEARNRKLAVAFGKMIATEANEADVQLSETLNRNAAISFFNATISTETENADVQMDLLMNDEAEVKTKTSAFRTGMNLQLNEADKELDEMVKVSILKNIKPIVATEADKMMDVLMNVPNISPRAAVDADCEMDKLINN